MMDAMYLVVRRSLHAGDTSYLTTERFRDGTGKLCALWSPMREHAKEYKTERAAHKAAVQYDGAVMKFSVLEDIARELLAARSARFEHVEPAGCHRATTRRN